MNMKKLVALVVLAVFIVGLLPAALAQPREQQRDNLSNQSVKEMDKDLKEMKRAEVKEVMQKTREQLQDTRDHLQKAKEKYEQVHAQLIEKKGQLKALEAQAKCSEKNEKCNAKKTELKKGVKEHLVHTVDLIDSSLEKLKARIEQAQQFSPEEKEQALTKIDELEAKLTTKRGEIEALGDTVTNQELKQQIKELKSLWVEVRKEQRQILTDLIRHAHENVVDAYGRFATQVDNQLTKLENLGADSVDISAAKELLVKYNEKTSELKDASAAAQQAWTQAKEDGTDESLAKAREAQTHFKAVAKETKDVLRDLLQALKQARQSIAKAKPETASSEETEQPETTQNTSGTPAE